MRVPAIAKWVFLTLHFLKSKYRNKLNVKNDLRLKLPSFNPDIDSFTDDKQPQKSYWDFSTLTTYFWVVLQLYSLVNIIKFFLHKKSFLTLIVLYALLINDICIIYIYIFVICFCKYFLLIHVVCKPQSFLLSNW